MHVFPNPRSSDFKVKKVQRADTSTSQFSPCHYTTTTVPLKQRLTTKKPSILSRETLQMSNITQYVTHGTNIENWFDCGSGIQNPVEIHTYSSILYGHSAIRNLF